MAVFGITFRIHEDASYAVRYNSVVEAIKKADSSNRWWAETTSFFLIESDLQTSANVANCIDSNSLFAEDKDLLVVINLTQRGYKVLGRYTDKDIDFLMERRGNTVS